MCRSLWQTPAAFTLIKTRVPAGCGVGSSISFNGALNSATLKLLIVPLPTGVVDLTFARWRRESSMRMSNPKPHQNLILASVPLVLTFVNQFAAISYECQNRDAGYWLT